jgi:hypothetical protein
MDPAARLSHSRLVGPAMIGFVAGVATLQAALLIPAIMAALVALGAPRILRSASKPRAHVDRRAVESGTVFTVMQAPDNVK